MKPEHTPGPWRVHNVPTSCGQAFKILDSTQPDDTGHGLIACIYDDHTSLNKRSSVEHEANARLIAAAPDLLAASQELVEYINVWKPDLDDHVQYGLVSKTEAAIKKATS